MADTPQIFGSMVFSDSVMKERLPRETYQALRRTMQTGKKLDPALANVVANAMKDWAVEKLSLIHIFCRSLTGWLAPRCPYLSFSVPAPRLSASSWCPRQIPIIGSLCSQSFCSSRIVPVFSAGSPGPFESTTPSGRSARISAAEAPAGTWTT